MANLRNSPCPCQSGKKIRDCHRGEALAMLGIDVPGPTDGLNVRERRDLGKALLRAHMVRAESSRQEDAPLTKENIETARRLATMGASEEEIQRAAGNIQRARKVADLFRDRVR